MNAELGCADMVRMAKGAAATVRAQHVHLSQLDSAFGDGDHGTTMLRIVDRLAAAIPVPLDSTPRRLLEQTGWEILGCDGGASSSLLGAFALGMAEALRPDSTCANCRELSAALQAGLNSARRHTHAQLGDKTLLDALIPAVRAFSKSVDRERDLMQVLAAAARAARAGAESTRALAARYGRGRAQGERTVGHQDAGATTIALLFEGFCDGFNETSRT